MAYAVKDYTHKDFQERQILLKFAWYLSSIFGPDGTQSFIYYSIQKNYSGVE